MHLNNYWLYRTFIGGRWERSRPLGWHRYDRKGKTPESILETEDHREDCWPLRLIVLFAIIIITVFCA